MQWIVEEIYLPRKVYNSHPRSQRWDVLFLENLLKLIFFSSMEICKLYKAFILPHFYYCSSVWHFCGARNADKVDNLNKRILRFILQDYSSPYDILLSKVNMKSLFIRRIQNFMITLYKSLFFMNYPGYLKDMFTLRSSICKEIISWHFATQKQRLKVCTIFHT